MECLEWFNPFQVHTRLWCFPLPNAWRFLLVEGTPLGQERVKQAIQTVETRWKTWAFHFVWTRLRDRSKYFLCSWKPLTLNHLATRTGMITDIRQAGVSEKRFLGPWRGSKAKPSEGQWDILKVTIAVEQGLRNRFSKTRPSPRSAILLHPFTKTSYQK